MSVPVLYLLVPIALLLAAAGVFGFLWAVRSGQYEDVHTPALRLLVEDEQPTAPPHPKEQSGASEVEPPASRAEDDPPHS